jgi:hypothetical protein
LIQTCGAYINSNLWSERNPQEEDQQTEIICDAYTG